MSAQILDGRAIAKKVREETKVQVEQLKQQGVQPGLAVVLVGENPASQIYVQNKTKACQEVGITVFDFLLPETTQADELIHLIRKLNSDSRIHGVLIQLPLPFALPTQRILEVLDPQKDVDGLLPENIGKLWQGKPRFVPCTPLGIVRLLKETKTSLSGSHTVIVGRSNLVGKPMAGLLLAENATVTMCHSYTKDLATFTKQADLIIAAMGKPEAIKGEWVKEGATIIDVGINRLADGKIVGDVEFEKAKMHAAWITPVPGGVGPMTIAMLLQNTVTAAAL